MPTIVLGLVFAITSLMGLAATHAERVKNKHTANSGMVTTCQYPNTCISTR